MFMMPFKIAFAPKTYLCSNCRNTERKTNVVMMIKNCLVRKCVNRIEQQEDDEEERSIKCHEIVKLRGVSMMKKVI